MRSPPMPKTPTQRRRSSCDAFSRRTPWSVSTLSLQRYPFERTWAEQQLEEWDARRSLCIGGRTHRAVARPTRENFEQTQRRHLVGATPRSNDLSGVAVRRFTSRVGQHAHSATGRGAPRDGSSRSCIGCKGSYAPAESVGAGDFAVTLRELFEPRQSRRGDRGRGVDLALRTKRATEASCSSSVRRWLVSAALAPTSAVRCADADVPVDAIARWSSRTIATMFRKASRRAGSAAAVRACAVKARRSCATGDAAGDVVARGYAGR